MLFRSKTVFIGGAVGALMETALMMKEPGQIHMIRLIRTNRQEPHGVTGANRESRRTGAGVATFIQPVIVSASSNTKVL